MLSQGLAPQTIYMGREGAPLIVIDDFARDARELVEQVASLPFLPVAGNFYPGRRRDAPQDYVAAVVEALTPLVQATFDLAKAPLVGTESAFSLVTTPPRELSMAQRLPHIDAPNLTKIAVLHYLCPPNFGGTSFYRHRATGFETITVERDAPYREKLTQELRAGHTPPMDFIRGDTALFERIHSIDAAFNRVAIYRSASLHSGNVSPDTPFDANPRTGRLSVNTFFYFEANGPVAIDPRSRQG
ncbi:MAG: DUF6445 family protein [Alphaproteobacteria bacterium]